MKQDFWLWFVNIWAKSIGAVIGGAIYFNSGGSAQSENYLTVALFSGYCALGYMVGNCFSALFSALAVLCCQDQISACEKNEKQGSDLRDLQDAPRSWFQDQISACEKNEKQGSDR